MLKENKNSRYTSMNNQNSKQSHAFGCAQKYNKSVKNQLSCITIATQSALLQKKKQSYSMSKSSTSKINVAFGGIRPGNPFSP